MTLWVVLPVKPMGRSKSRLAQVLCLEERRALSESLLIHTLDCLSQTPGVAGIAVVSADPQVRALAGAWEATWIEDSPEAGLNRALIRGRRHALRAGARQVLVLPADLPRLTPQALAAMLAMVDSPPSAVIAPDRHGSGTNALLLAPPGLIEYTFGPLSFMRHLERAEAAGARTLIFRSPAFALDLDLPEDLALLSEPGPSPDLRA